MADERNKPAVNLRPGRGHGPGGPHGMGMPKEKPKNTRAVLARIIRYIGKSKGLLFGMLGVMILATVLNVLSPSVLANAIDAVTVTPEHPVASVEEMLRWLAVLAVMYLLAALFTYFQSLFAAMLSQHTVRIMRKDLFAKISRLPIKYMDTHKHGDIMSRMTNDVENVSNSVSQSLGSLISGVIMLVGCLSMMLYYSWQLTLISMVTIALTLIVTTFLSKFMRKYYPLQQRTLGELNGQIEEAVSGYKTVKAFTHEQVICEDFNRTSDKLCEVAIKAQTLGGIMGPCMNFVGNIGFLLIAVFGGWFAIEHIITIGTIQAFITYSKQFTRPINEIANQYSMIQTALAGAERVFEIMDSEPETDEGKSDLDIESVRGDLNFKGIDFSYVQGEQVLKDFDLWVKSGQKIAIVGATGSGKTTVVNLLTRFYDIDGGEITLDGTSIYDIPKNKLRGSIGIVLQDTVIFTDTIAQNIRYGRIDASDEEVRAAARFARVDEFAEKLENGYDTMLTEGGSNISQGQRQLIAIARAVLANPKILILDEATSSIDTRTEMHIQEAMLKLMKGRTSLIIAHRLSTIRDADKIVVISGGKVVEAGNHEELLKQHGCYYDLYQSQFAGIAT
ncbi:MAG: ABC transporter ATP-binding protein [Oscillospiraceae bacterium]